MEIGDPVKCWNVVFTDHIMTSKIDLIKGHVLSSSYLVRGCFITDTKLYPGALLSSSEFEQSRFIITSSGDVLTFFESVNLTDSISLESMQNLELIGVPF